MPTSVHWEMTVLPFVFTEVEEIPKTCWYSELLLHKSNKQAQVSEMKEFRVVLSNTTLDRVLHPFANSWTNIPTITVSPCEDFWWNFLCHFRMFIIFMCIVMRSRVFLNGAGRLLREPAISYSVYFYHLDKFH